MPVTTAGPVRRPQDPLENQIARRIDGRDHTAPLGSNHDLINVSAAPEAVADHDQSSREGISRNRRGQHLAQRNGVPLEAERRTTDGAAAGYRDSSSPGVPHHTSGGRRCWGLGLKYRKVEYLSSTDSRGGIFAPTPRMLLRAHWPPAQSPPCRPEQVRCGCCPIGDGCH